MKSINQTRLNARFAGFVLAVLAMLVLGTTAHGQSREGQYGPPTDSGNVAGHALGVLPDTGGPLIPLVGALVFTGTGVVLVRRARRG